MLYDISDVYVKSSPSTLEGGKYYIHSVAYHGRNIGGLGLFYNDVCVQLIHFPDISEDVLRTANLESWCRRRGQYLPYSESLSATYSYALVGDGVELANLEFEREISTLGAQNLNQDLIIPQPFQWNSHVSCFSFSLILDCLLYRANDNRI